MNHTELLESAVPLITAWYRENGRHLPWRDDPTPYHVWISEIMLQQTRIEAVIPYYVRFLEAFPTVHDLARADNDRLMKMWEGLGYYSRARNIKKAAGVIVEQYGGELPDTVNELKKLPGIGDYTAGAIASIAYGQPEPAVDGNVLRVIARILCDSGDIADPAVKKACTGMLREIYPMGDSARLLTEGIMELGERICIPNGAPRCDDCPVNGFCRSYLEGTTEKYPVKSPKKPRRLENRTVLLLRCGNPEAWNYAIRKRGAGLLSGMWEFVSAEGHLSTAECANFLRAKGLEPIEIKPGIAAKHIFTHVEWHMIGYDVTVREECDGLIWRRPEDIRGNYAIPTALKKYADRME